VTKKNRFITPTPVWHGHFGEDVVAVAVVVAGAAGAAVAVVAVVADDGNVGRGSDVGLPVHADHFEHSPSFLKMYRLQNVPDE
jgi:hypothetical protein